MTEQNASATTVAAFLSELLAASEKTQRQIADECSLESPNVITMFKTGATKIPLNRIGPLAKALDADPAHLLRLAMAEYMPDTWDSIENIMRGSILTANELDLVRRFRIATADKDPRPVSLSLNPGTVYSLVTH